MTKRHFEAIAKIVAQSSLCWDSRRELAVQFIRYFQNENPLFDGEKFLKACDASAEDREELPRFYTMSKEEEQAYENLRYGN